MARQVVLALSTIFKVRGGIPRFNQMFCLALDQLAEELALDVTVFSIDDDHADYRQAGSPWRHLRFVPAGSQFGILRKVVLHSMRTKPDILIAGILGMSPVGLLSSPFLKSGYGYFAHGVEVWDRPKWSRRAAARRAARAFPVSRDTAGFLHRASGLPLDRMRVLHNTLTPSFFVDDDAPDAPAVEQGFDLLSVARLWKDERMKGIDTTIEAFSRIAAEFPAIRYRIVGKGDDKPRLRAMAADCGLTDRILFEEDLGDEELLARYRDCGVFVLPSGQEGFGIVFLEAMRYAKPCIGGNVGGTPEVVADGETGLLVPFGDVDALETALRRLVPDNALRRTMGQAGFARLKSRFLFPRYRERVREIVIDWIGEP